MALTFNLNTTLSNISAAAQQPNRRSDRSCNIGEVLNGTVDEINTNPDSVLEPNCIVKTGEGNEAPLLQLRRFEVCTGTVNKQTIKINVGQLKQPIKVNTECINTVVVDDETVFERKDEILDFDPTKLDHIISGSILYFQGLIIGIVVKETNSAKFLADKLCIAPGQKVNTDPYYLGCLQVSEVISIKSTPDCPLTVQTLPTKINPTHNIKCIELTEQPTTPPPPAEGPPPTTNAPTTTPPPAEEQPTTAQPTEEQQTTPPPAVEQTSPEAVGKTTPPPAEEQQTSPQAEAVKSTPQPAATNATTPQPTKTTPPPALGSTLSATQVTNASNPAALALEPSTTTPNSEGHGLDVWQWSLVGGGALLILALCYIIYRYCRKPQAGGQAGGKAGGEGQSKQNKESFVVDMGFVRPDDSKVPAKEKSNEIQDLQAKSEDESKAGAEVEGLKPQEPSEQAFLGVNDFQEDSEAGLDDETNAGVEMSQSPEKTAAASLGSTSTTSKEDPRVDVKKAVQQWPPKN